MMESDGDGAGRHDPETKGRHHSQIATQHRKTHENAIRCY